VNRDIETREAITVAAGGTRLRGIYHKAYDGRPGTRTVGGEGNRIGLLFPNPGYLPIAGAGDSAVYWADSLAKLGYPVFRLDLPGLGDADGDVPEEMLNFVNTGRYAPVLSAAMTELIERFRLSGMVIVGHCAGAVSALYTAAIDKDCKGLVLLDPYFHLPQCRVNVRRGLRGWVLKSRLGGCIGNTKDRLKHIGTLVRGNRPPGNANWPLIRCWRQLESVGMPILILKAPAPKAPGIKPRVGEFDYLRYLRALPGHTGRVAVRFVEGTNHSFANSNGRAAVRQHTEQWLDVYFPSAEGEETGGPEHSLRPNSQAAIENGTESLTLMRVHGSTGNRG
jgi:pimeloyl-ACP methyl ester carboxylesterase